MKLRAAIRRKDERGGHRIPALDGLRAISICLVLAAHLLPLGPKYLNLNSTAGPMGMSLFFTLSGYLIVTTLRGATILEFVVKRLARILPLAYMYIFLVFIVFGLSRQALLSHLSFIVNYRLDQMLPVTEHLWSLCVEVHFYVLITVLAATGGRRALLLVWPACAAITAMRVMGGTYIDVATHLRMNRSWPVPVSPPCRQFGSASAPPPSRSGCSRRVSGRQHRIQMPAGCSICGPIRRVSFS